MRKVIGRDRWIKVDLEELCEINMGQSPPSSSYNYHGDGLPFYQGVRHFGSKYPSPSVFCNAPKKIAEQQDVLLSVRAPIGAINMVKEKCCIGRGLAALRHKKGNNEFLFHLMKYIQTMWHAFDSRGTVFGCIGKHDIATFPVVIPEDEQDQQGIGSVLSAYDDLIELNERRIKILEETARLIYNEWFVKFRFPGYEKVEMVDSELGMIPKGWEATNLGTVLDLIESGSRPKGGAEDVSDGVPSIGAENVLGLGKFDFNKIRYVSKSFFKNMRSGVVKNGDVLLYKDGAQIGRKTYFDEDFPFKPCCINEHIFILRANKRISQKYLFFWLDQPWVTQEIINLNSNAAQPGINKPSVKTLPILIPSREIVNLFGKVVTPITKMLFTCCEQNTILRQTRNMFLPKLISGEIDVSDLSIKVEQNA